MKLLGVLATSLLAVALSGPSASADILETASRNVRGRSRVVLENLKRLVESQKRLLRTVHVRRVLGLRKVLTTAIDLELGHLKLRDLTGAAPGPNAVRETKASGTPAPAGAVHSVARAMNRALERSRTALRQALQPFGGSPAVEAILKLWKRALKEGLALVSTIRARGAKTDPYAKVWSRYRPDLAKALDRLWTWAAARDTDAIRSSIFQVILELQALTAPIL